MKEAVLALYRIRIPVYYLAVAILICNAFTGRLMSSGEMRQVWLLVLFAAFGLMVLSIALAYLAPRCLSEHQDRVVSSPVQGRWLSMNSPATKVPSHGVRAYGQAYAIDLVHEPADGIRPAFGGPIMRRSREYPAFGHPVLAMIDGTVVRASGWRRDHRARSNGWAVIYMMIEGMIRELGGPGFVVGNHVTIRGDDGIYATVAHLQRGSVTANVGDRILAGTPIGLCGNSGNSSEPHVHAQLMDRASFWTAQGLPMVFAGITIGEDTGVLDAIPEDGQYMTVPK